MVSGNTDYSGKIEDDSQIILRNPMVVTDFCTEVRGAFSTLSSAKSSGTISKALLEGGSPLSKIGLRSWIKIAICVAVTMVATLLLCFFLYLLPTALANQVQEQSAGSYELPLSTVSAELLDYSNETFTIEERFNGTSSTEIESGFTPSLLAYLQGFFRSARHGYYDFHDDDDDTTPRPSWSQPLYVQKRVDSDLLEPLGNGTSVNGTEDVPDPEALRGKYVAYVPVVIGDSSDEEDDNDEDMVGFSKVQYSEPVRVRPVPGRRADFPGRNNSPMSLLQAAEVARRRHFLMQQILAMKASHSRRHRPSHLPSRNFAPPLVQRSFARPVPLRQPPLPILPSVYQARRFEDTALKSSPRGTIPEYTASPSGYRVRQVYSDPSERSQLHQFTSIQDIIEHIDSTDRRRQPSSQSRDRYTSTKYRTPTYEEDRPPSSRSSGKKPYSFMLDLYPLGGSRSKNTNAFTEESRIEEDYEDRKRRREEKKPREESRSSSRYETDVKELRRLREEVDAYRKTKESQTQEETRYANYSPNSYMPDRDRKKEDQYDTEPTFTIDDILKALTNVAMKESSSSRKTNVLPKFPDNVIQSRDMEALDSWTYLKGEVPPRNKNDYHGYVNIENHKPEPLPFPLSVTGRPESDEIETEDK